MIPDTKAPTPLAGERRVVTVLFADIAGFTSLAESMDPEEVLMRMNECFDILVPIIEKYGGSIDKFIGDEIMALFGAPYAHEDDPVRALRAALEMMKAQQDHNDGRGIQLSLHIGINTGLAIAGGIGSKGRQTYSVLGDAVNVAFRLKSASQPGEILVGPDTFRLTAPLFTFEALDPVQVRGRNEPVSIYRVLEARSQPESLRGLAGLKSPMVGRQAELTHLIDLTKALCSGVGAAALITGEAGLGKSRLVMEWRKEVELRTLLPGMQWGGGHCLSYERGLAYHLVAMLLRSVLALPDNTAELEASAQLAAQIERLFSDFADAEARAAALTAPLAHLLSLPTSPKESARLSSLEPQALHTQYLEAIRLLLIAIAQKAPLVLVVEDFHWIDPSSADLLQGLIPIVQAAPIFFCIITRPETDSPGWELTHASRQALQNHWQDIQLQRLADHESQQLIANLLATDQPPSSITDLVLQKADGNPLFIEELIRMLIDNGSISRLEGQWAVNHSMNTEIIPSSLQGLLMERIDRLPARARQVLRVAAVIGRRFTTEGLKASLPQEYNASLQQQLGYLQSSNVIRPVKAGNETEYVFQNTLGQEAAYLSLLHQDRKLLHLQVGEALEKLHTANIAQHAAALAHHFSQADSTQKARRYFLLAGDLAFHKYALPEAIQHFTRALEMCQASPAAEIRSDIEHIFTHLGRAYELSNFYQEAVQTYIHVENLAKESGCLELLLSAQVEHARLISTPTPVFDTEISHRLCRQALKLARQLKDPASEARIHWIFMLSYWLADSQKAIKHGLRSLQIARAHHLQEQLAYTLHDLHRAYSSAGDIPHAQEALREAGLLWRTLGNLPLLADNLASSADQAIDDGRYEEALNFANEADQISRTIGNLWSQAYAQEMIGIVRMEYGQVDAAIHHLQESIRMARLAGVKVLVYRSASELASLYHLLGAVAEVEALTDLIAMFMEEYKDTNDRFRFISLQGIRSITAVYCNDLEKATRLIHESDQRLDSISPNLVKPMIAKVQVLIAQHQFEEAIRLGDGLITLIDQHKAGRFKSQILILKSKALLGQQDLDGAWRVLVQAHASVQKRNAHIYLPHILSLLVKTARLRHDPATAENYRQQAQASIERLLSNTSDPSIRDTFLKHPEIQFVLSEGAGNGS